MTCSECRATMTVELRTVIFQKRIELKYVPIHVCTRCDHAQVLPIVKPELQSWLKKSRHTSEKKQVSFNRISRHADLLHKVAMHLDETERRADEDQVGDLLDLWILADSLGDEAWAQDIRGRLQQFV